MNWQIQLIRRLTGYTLVECLIVLSIVGFTLVISISSYVFLINEATSKVVSQQLLQAISLARSEAQLNGTPIILCGSQDGVTCSRTWDKSYILQMNHKTQHKFKYKGLIHWRGSLGLSYLQFLPNGSINYQDGTFWYADKEGQLHWQIVINHSGRARLAFER